MIWMILWTVLLLLVACVWASRHLELNRAKREEIPLDSTSYDRPPADAPFVSVLIAAKDEEANIESAVLTMLEQDYPRFELIVINDRSRDRTAEILENLKAQHPDKLRVIHIRELREGWFGKNNAMREGVEQARGEWLCFGDADCRQTSPRSLSMAVCHALDRKVDFLSVLPRLETQSIWERIIQPVCGAVMVFWFNPRWVNDPQHKAAYANGAFMLMSRDCYEALGGHEAVKTHVNEDMQMALKCKQIGRRLRVVQNRDLYTVRMYSRFSEIWRGWSRIFYGCFGTFRRLRVSLLMLLCTNVFPYVSALIGALVLALHGTAAGPAWMWVTAAAWLAVIMQQSVIGRFYKIGQINPLMAPTFIIGAFVCIGMLINAMLKLNGRTTVNWRGTVYRGDQVAKPAGEAANSNVEYSAGHALRGPGRA